MMRRLALLVVIAGMGCNRRLGALETAAFAQFTHYAGSGDSVAVGKCRIEKLPPNQVREFRARYLFAPSADPLLGTCTMRLTFHDWPSRGQPAPVERDVRFVWLENADQWERWTYQPPLLPTPETAIPTRGP
jgi:hypothetical protein